MDKRLKLVQTLIQEGAPVDVRDSVRAFAFCNFSSFKDLFFFFLIAVEQNQSTPLHLATVSGHKDIVNYLISKHANVNLVDIVRSFFYLFSIFPRQFLHYCFVNL